MFTGNWSFSNTKNAAKSVTKDIEGVTEALSHLDDNTVTDKTVAALQGIDLQAKNTKSSLNQIKMPNIVQQNAKINAMQNVAGNKLQLDNKKVKVGYQFDANPNAKIEKQLKN